MMPLFGLIAFALFEFLWRTDPMYSKGLRALSLLTAGWSG